MLFHPFPTFTSTASLTSIVPSCVSVCEHPRQRPALRSHGEEGGIISASRMSLSRLKEFQLGRACAHQALDFFGAGDMPIRTDTNRAPLWPAGVVGSITHCTGYSAAAVARQTDLLSIGVNARHWRDRSTVLAAEIAAPQEIAQLSREGFSIETALELIVSAKKSLFKAMRSHAEAEFGFRSVELAFDKESASFLVAQTSASCVEDYRGMIFGRFVFDEVRLLTSVAASRWNVPGCR